MENNKDFLGTQPVGKLLFKLAIPTVIAQLINMLYNIVDRIFIGHIPDAGSLALTGVGVTMPIIMIVSAFAGLVSSGGAPRASISMGKGDMDSAEQTLGGCFLFTGNCFNRSDSGTFTVWRKFAVSFLEPVKIRLNMLFPI